MRHSLDPYMSLIVMPYKGNIKYFAFLWPHGRKDFHTGKGNTNCDISNWYAIVHSRPTLPNIPLTIAYQVMRTDGKLRESESESERYLFDPHKKLIQSNNEKQ